MKIHIEVLFSSILELTDAFKDFVINKPLLTVLFPASGLGVSCIPNLTISVGSPTLDFISTITPYIRFVFLILTLLLTIVSLILQIRKLRNKDK